MQSTCSVKECDGQVRSRGMCNTHYRSELRKRAPKCGVDMCANPTRARGLCTTHLARLNRYGDLRPCDPIRPIVPGRTCAVVECGKPYSQHGYCKAHAARFRRHENPLGGVIRYSGEPCLIDGCDRPAVSNMMCHRHDELERKRKIAGFTGRDCVLCGTTIDFGFTPGKRARDMRASRCSECRKPKVNSKAQFLRQRDGDQCHLCLQGIDFGLQWPDPWSKSVDHVVPVSLGGSDCDDNLRLAHLRCNVLRQADPVELARERLLRSLSAAKK